MLAERPYMRGEYHREKTSALIWLLSAIGAGFLVQLMFGAWLEGAGERLTGLAGLSTSSLKSSWGGTLLTHGFLHSTRFVFHALANGLLLFFLGRELIPLIGSRRFTGLFLATNIFGALGWLAIHWHRPADAHVGVTAAVSGLFIVLACFNPNQRIDFLLFFLWPVTPKLKHIALVWLGFDLIGFFLHELPATALPLDLTLSHSAHLGGMLAGFVYVRWIHHARWFNPEDRGDAARPRWLPGSTSAPAKLVAPGFDLAPPATSPEDIRAEVDRILDKINSHGLGSLTPVERRLLDDAKDNIPRR